MKKYPLDFVDILNHPEGKDIIEQIEEIGDNRELELKRIKQSLINKLERKFGYKYE